MVQALIVSAEGLEDTELLVPYYRLKLDVIIYPDRLDDTRWRNEEHRLAPEDLFGVPKRPPRVLIEGEARSHRFLVP